jgi:hypothetical protein
MSAEKPKESSILNFDFKRIALIEYMKVKMDDGDWHGVSDAANDLRVLEAQPKFTLTAEYEVTSNTIRPVR